MIRVLCTALVFLAAVGSGCTLTPIYGTTSQQANALLSFRYAEPSTRLEQVVYQELSLRFDRATGLDAPELTISTSRRGRSLGRTSDQALDQREVTISARVTVTQNGQVLYTATRQASALYTEGRQVLATVSGNEEAEERAARAAAESLRLALLARFAGSNLQQ